MCDCNFPSLVASFFSWRCLAPSSSSSLHAAMNLRPPSVTASTQTSAFNAVVFQSPVMPNARMSLCTQSVHWFFFPPRPLRTAPSRFQHACLVFVVDHTRCMYGICLREASIYNSSAVIIMLPPCSFSLFSSSHSYDETITIRHPRNDAAACVRCVLHPLHLPLSSCLGCIPPLIGLPFLRFYAVVSSLFLLFVFSIFFVYRDDVLCWLLSCPFSSVCFPCLSPNFFPVWFGLVPSIL